MGTLHGPFGSPASEVAVRPACPVHCSLLDLAKYTAFHVAGHRGNTPLLPQVERVQRHSAVPNNGGCAYGWLETTRPWINGLVLTHSGSNVQWYSVLWMAPNREFAVVALCNIAAPSGPNPGAIATDPVVGKRIQTFLTQ